MVAPAAPSFTPNCRGCAALRTQLQTLSEDAQRHGHAESEALARAGAAEELVSAERARFRRQGKEIGELRAEIAEVTRRLSAQQRRLSEEAAAAAAGLDASPGVNLRSHGARHRPTGSAEAHAESREASTPDDVERARGEEAEAARALGAEASAALQLVRLARAAAARIAPEQAPAVTLACDAVLAACIRAGVNSGSAAVPAVGERMDPGETPTTAPAMERAPALRRGPFLTKRPPPIQGTGRAR